MCDIDDSNLWCCETFQTFDVSTFDAFIGIAFGVPSADKHVTGPTFGTLVSIANLCLKLLSKVSVYLISYIIFVCFLSRF